MLAFRSVLSVRPHFLNQILKCIKSLAYKVSAILQTYLLVSKQENEFLWVEGIGENGGVPYEGHIKQLFSFVVLKTEPVVLEPPNGQNQRFEPPNGQTQRFEPPKGQNQRFEPPKGQNRKCAPISRFLQNKRSLHICTLCLH